MFPPKVSKRRRERQKRNLNGQLIPLACAGRHERMLFKYFKKIEKQKSRRITMPRTNQKVVSFATWSFHFYFAKILKSIIAYDPFCNSLLILTCFLEQNVKLFITGADLASEFGWVI